MIPEAELRRLAGAWNADVTVIERDYVLAWVLAGLYRRPALEVSVQVRRTGFEPVIPCPKAGALPN